MRPGSVRLGLVPVYVEVARRRGDAHAHAVQLLGRDHLAAQPRPAAAAASIQPQARAHARHASVGRWTHRRVPERSTEAAAAPLRGLTRHGMREGGKPPPPPFARAPGQLEAAAAGLCAFGTGMCMLRLLLVGLLPNHAFAARTRKQLERAAGGLAGSAFAPPSTSAGAVGCPTWPHGQQRTCTPPHTQLQVRARHVELTFP